MLRFSGKVQEQMDEATQYIKRLTGGVCKYVNSEPLCINARYKHTVKTRHSFVRDGVSFDERPYRGRITGVGANEHPSDDPQGPYTDTAVLGNHVYKVDKISLIWNRTADDKKGYSWEAYLLIEDRRGLSPDDPLLSKIVLRPFFQFNKHGGTIAKFKLSGEGECCDD